MLTQEVRAARWRRLDSYLATVQRLGGQAGHEVPDAIAPALDEMYGLWEAWHQSAGLNFEGQDRLVTGDPDAETTAALVFARGGKAHAGVEFGSLLGFGLGGFGEGPFGAGGWHWQPYSDPTSRYAKRNGWYAQHVAWQPVAPVLDAACRWLRNLPGVRL